MADTQTYDVEVTLVSLHLVCQNEHGNGTSKNM